ncbi:MAG TPA: LysM peptidoglycan-binding domain-containing protein, partial [Anaerolineales bacterium]
MNTKVRALFTRISIGLLSTFTALSVAFAVLPQTASAAAAVTCTSNYLIKSGDTIYTIGRRYDVGVRTLAAANNLTAPYTLKAGNRLCIPDESTFTVTPVGVGNLGMTAPTKFSFSASSAKNHIEVKLTDVKSTFSFKARVQDPNA